MWLPTKYWLLWILLLESAPAGAPSATKAASRVGDPSSRLEPGDELRTRTTVNDEARMRDVQNSTRSHRGFGYYSKEMGKYMKLLSKSLGTLLGSLQRESPRRSDDSSDAEDVESAGSQSKLTVKESPAAGAGGNSLLSKINKGFNYTSGISKYLSSMPAVRGLTSTFTGAVASVQDYFKLIKPGTQWCGDGDRAKSFEDLGLFYKTDACCREHDSCPDFILSGTEKHGLKNDGVFTKLHCDCDIQFYQCLKSVHSAIALSTGFEYFNILKPPCFKKEHPVIGCNAYNRIYLKAASGRSFNVPESGWKESAFNSSLTVVMRKYGNGLKIKNFCGDTPTLSLYSNARLELQNVFPLPCQGLLN